MSFDPYEHRANIRDAKWRREHFPVYAPKLPTVCLGCGLSRSEASMQEPTGWHPLLRVCEKCFVARRRKQWAEAQAVAREYNRPVTVKFGDTVVTAFNEKRLCPDCVVTEGEDGEFYLTLCKICQYHVAMLTKIDSSFTIPRPLPPNVSVLTNDGMMKYEKYREDLARWNEHSLALKKQQDEARRIVTKYWRVTVQKRLRRARNARYRRKRRK